MSFSLSFSPFSTTMAPSPLQQPGTLSPINHISTLPNFFSVSSSLPFTVDFLLSAFRSISGYLGWFVSYLVVFTRQASLGSSYSAARHLLPSFFFCRLNFSVLSSISGPVKVTPRWQSEHWSQQNLSAQFPPSPDPQLPVKGICPRCPPLVPSAVPRCTFSACW